MTPEQIARLCREAQQRLDYWIARAVAQQKRRFSETWNSK